MSGPEKKKKKRKHDAEASTSLGTSLFLLSPLYFKGQTLTVIPEPTTEESDKKEKKKKRKRDGAAEIEIDLENGEPTTAATLESKKDKQDKKDKKKRRKLESSTGASSLPTPSTSAGPSKASSPTPKPASSGEVQEFLTKHAISIEVPPSTSPVHPVLSFAELCIPEKLRPCFAGFKEPTPIQACTWPPALDGRDVVGIAETGSGKTLAFGIPALSRLIQTPPSSSSSESAITTLVMAPTRELALQTHETLSALGKLFRIGSVAVFGGVPKEPQVKLMRNLGKGNNKKDVVTRIIVGTPGRILDLVQAGVCDLSQ
jgi:ATP-dependent RNA helicase DBP3